MTFLLAFIELHGRYVWHEQASRNRWQLLRHSLENPHLLYLLHLKPSMQIDDEIDIRLMRRQRLPRM